MEHGDLKVNKAEISPSTRIVSTGDGKSIVKHCIGFYHDESAQYTQSTGRKQNKCTLKILHTARLTRALGTIRSLLEIST